MSYAEYLRSDEWRRLREAALRRAGHRCHLCGHDRRLEVHHRDYETIGSERVEDLVVLCLLCHTRHHVVLEAPRAPRAPLDPAKLANALSAYSRARARVDREKGEGAA